MIADAPRALAPGSISKRIQLLIFVEATTVYGAAKNVLDFCRTAAERVVTGTAAATEPCIVTFVRGSLDGLSNDFILAARRQGLPVEVIRERFAFDLRVLPQLRSIVNARRPDIVVTHSVKSHFLLWLTRVWKKYPWIAVHHGYTATDSKNHLYNLLDRLSLRRAQRVVTVCRAFAQRLCREGVSHARLRVVHNSIGRLPRSTSDTLQELRGRYGIHDDERVVLAVGRLSQEKGHRDLIDAVAVLLRRAPHLRVRLLLVGDGPERHRLEAHVASLGLRHVVVIAGHQPDIAPYYALASVFVLPSYTEGSPLVLLEALAAGLPIVATAVGGVPEMVQHTQTALLVPPRRPDAVAEALHLLITDHESARAMRAKAQDLLANRFRPEQHAAAMMETFLEVCR